MSSFISLQFLESISENAKIIFINRPAGYFSFFHIAKKIIQKIMIKLMLLFLRVFLEDKFLKLYSVKHYFNRFLVFPHSISKMPPLCPVYLECYFILCSSPGDTFVKPETNWLRKKTCPDFSMHCCAEPEVLRHWRQILHCL